MHSAKSLGTGRVAESGLTLRPNAVYSAEELAEDPEGWSPTYQSNNGASRYQEHSRGGQAGDDVDDSKPPGRSTLGYDEPIMLTQSTHSFLFTEPTCSLPFAFAILVIIISYVCLMLALLNNLLVDWSSDNPFNVPVGVTLDVKIAQYLALLIGLIMEEEIPESLYLLRMISKKTLYNRAPFVVFGKFIFCALLRIVMGYLFYLNMFVVVVQATAVIDIFYDVLALQFLQQVDDIVFHLARRDVFGKRMKKASTRTCFEAEFEKLPYSRRKKMTIFVKVLYIVNLIAMLVGLTIITVKQIRGDYHCDSITAIFDHHIWQDALVRNATGGVEKMDLIYSYFSGVYVRNGTSNGRPIYTEQSKFDNTPYHLKTGATIKYCEEESAWVFMHENIRRDMMEARRSDCPWLLRSQKTNEFNLLEVPSDWYIWTGVVTPGATLKITCNTCDSDTDCNYHGVCIEGTCICDESKTDGYMLYTGSHCQFPRPCIRIQGVEGDVWDLVLINDGEPWKAYGRGVYRYVTGGNFSGAGLEDDLLQIYSGSRWFAALFEKGRCRDLDYWMQFSREYHPFWDEIYDERTHGTSDPTTGSDPIAVDFYKIGRRGQRWVS